MKGEGLGARDEGRGGGEGGLMCWLTSKPWPLASSLAQSSKSTHISPHFHPHRRSNTQAKKATRPQTTPWSTPQPSPLINQAYHQATCTCMLHVHTCMQVHVHGPYTPSTCKVHNPTIIDRGMYEVSKMWTVWQNTCCKHWLYTLKLRNNLDGFRKSLPKEDIYTPHWIN